MWVEFYRLIVLLLSIKASVQNVAADALSRKHALLTTLLVKIIGFDVMKELYYDDLDFGRFGRLV